MAILANAKVQLKLKWKIATDRKDVVKLTKLEQSKGNLQELAVKP